MLETSQVVDQIDQAHRFADSLFTDILQVECREHFRVMHRSIGHPIFLDEFGLGVHFHMVLVAVVSLVSLLGPARMDIFLL